MRNELDYLKRMLNEKDYSVWNKFIDTYSFPPEYDSLYYSFIINNRRNDAFYKSSLIDLTYMLGFFDLKMKNHVSKVLMAHKNYFVQEACLNYFRYLPKITKKDILLIQEYYDKISNRRVVNSSILIMQVYIINARYYSEIGNQKKERLYYELYKSKLVRSRSWKVVIKVKNSLEIFEYLKKYKKELTPICKELNKKYSHGLF